jgi:hypothetical protein
MNPCGSPLDNQTVFISMACSGAAAVFVFVLVWLMFRKKKR